MTEHTKTTTDEGKKWAGKYDTPEAMEEALKSKDAEYSKMTETNRKLASDQDALKREMELATRAPERYELPAGSEVIKDDLERIERIARNANLSQDAFAKIVSEQVKDAESKQSELKAARKKVGDTNIILLEEFVEKNYPEGMRESVMDRLLLNQKDRDEALAARQKQLSSRVPGMDSANGNGGREPAKTDGQKEVRDLAEEYQRRPSDKDVRKALIEKAKEVGHARFPDRK